MFGDTGTTLTESISEGKCKKRKKTKARENTQGENRDKIIFVKTYGPKKLSGTKQKTVREPIVFRELE